METYVVTQAKRCLNCKRPLCREGCPIQTPIPQMIQHLLHGEIRQAGDMLFANNPLSVVCSLVCDHEKQCQGHCVLGRKGEPVHIPDIEHYISDFYLDQLELHRAPCVGQRVAIVGSGPAGITISIFLAQKGYDVTLFESRDKIGGVLRYGIPEFRLPKSILDRYIPQLKRLGIKFRPNTAIGGAITINDLQRDGYEAIFIGIGVWQPKTLGIKGESLGHVHFAIDYLVNPDVYDLGDHLVIVGAGNSAMDVARTALRKGVRRVTIFCRRLKASASSDELGCALADGASVEYGVHPVEITDQGVIYQRSIFDDQGNKIGDEPPQLFPASSVVVAASQGPRAKVISTTGGLSTSDTGLLEVDAQGHTSRPGVFASGDIVLGARTVVEAVKYSKEVARAMDEYLCTLRQDRSTQ